MIAWTDLLQHLHEHVLGPGHDPTAPIQWRQCYLWIPVNACVGFQPDMIARKQGGAEFIGVHASAHGIASGLQGNQDAVVADFSPEPFQRQPDGCRVMGKIIVHIDPVRFGNQFQPPFHALEG